MFLGLAAIYAVPAAILLFMLDKYFLSGFLGKHQVFLDFDLARLAILALCLLLILYSFIRLYFRLLHWLRQDIYENPAVSRLLYQESDDAIFAFRLTSTGDPADFLGGNSRACERLGYTQDELRRLTLRDITAGTAPAPPGDLADHLLAGAPLSYETIHCAKDGREIPVAVTLHPVPSRWRTVVLCVARELTERINVEEERRQAHEALQVLARNSPLAIIGFDRELKVTRWNEAAELLLGWTQSEVLGKTLSKVLKSEVTNFTTLCTLVLQGETLQGVKARHPRKDGSMVDISLCLAPTFNAQGAVNGLIGMIVNLTERIRTGEELLRVNRALKVLSEAKRAISRASDESALLHDVCRILIDIGGYRFAWIGVPAPDGEKSITQLAYVGDGEWYLDLVNPSWKDLRQESNPTVKAMRLGNVALVRNLLCFPDTSPWLAEALNRGYGSAIALPITAWQPAGALTIFAGELDAFDAEEVELLDELADDIAYGVESLRLRDERRHAEETLVAYARQWRTTFDAISDPVYVVDPAGVITQCNKALANFICIPYDNIIGRKSSEVFHGTSPFLEECLFSRVQETRRSESEIFPIGDRFFKVTFDPLLNGDDHYLGSIQVMDDVTERIKAEEEFKANFARLKGLLNNTITTIAKIVEMRDPYTAGHEHRVSLLACSIAREMGLSEDTIEGIRVAGMLHDIGKLYVPSEILSKTGALNEIEQVMIRMHAQAGFETLKNIDFPWPVAKIVQQHHERINGSGYPAGLSGGDILIEARILAVADVVDSMASHRPYRPSRGIAASLQEIEANSGILYDGVVARACRRLFEQGFTLEGDPNGGN